jgi:hypothetical protein
MDLFDPQNRAGVIRLGQFIRPELKMRVLELAEEVESLEALRTHPTYREFTELSTMGPDFTYPPLPEKYRAK